MKWITLLLFICACSSKKSQNRVETVKVDSEVEIVHKDKKYTIYAKQIRVERSYISHVVWAVDSLGNIKSISTH